jgi:hypothetical protein
MRPYYRISSLSCLKPVIRKLACVSIGKLTRDEGRGTTFLRTEMREVKFKDEVPQKLSSQSGAVLKSTTFHRNHRHF